MFSIFTQAGVDDGLLTQVMKPIRNTNSEPGLL